MSDAFKDREKGYEAKFQLDEELRFKAESRRNKLLGLWLAEAFGLKGSDADAYAKEVVLADLDEPGVEDVVRKVMADIEARGLQISEDDIRRKLEDLLHTAAEQLQSE
ncbi:MAG TPA: DUF1476 domain-containing protein [Rhodospirillaceae bacterium]|mgnify:FL=1|nr:DUF1476 domain-containing protein [Rhodospirillaceae bacterium]